MTMRLKIWLIYINFETSHSYTQRKLTRLVYTEQNVNVNFNQHWRQWTPLLWPSIECHLVWTHL